MKPEPKGIMKTIIDAGCPKCGSRHTYYRRKTEDHVCQKCGNVWRDEG